MFLPQLRRREPAAEYSAASQSSIADPRPARLDLGNVDPQHRVRLREARGPSIPRALPQADSHRADRQVPAHGPDLERGLPSERLVPALAHALALADHRRLVKRRARSALRRVAEAVANNSTPRPKKAR